MEPGPRPTSASWPNRLVSLRVELIGQLGSGMAERPTKVDNPWLDRRVICYAHQGGAWEAPSSTLYAISKAIEAGATGIELDVHATADGRLVVSHDETVDRTTNGRGRISEMTLDELSRLDNAYWFVPGADVTPGLADSDYPFRGLAPRDRRFAVATLDEVLELLSDYPRIAVNLDIKQTAPAVEPYEEKLATLLSRYGRSDSAIVASFLDPATEAFSRYAPHVGTSAGTLAVGEFWRALHDGREPAPMRHVSLQVPLAVGDIVVVDDSFVAAAHQRLMAVHVWTIDDEDQMRRLVGMGVDGIITDLPTTLVKVLESMGATWVP